MTAEDLAGLIAERYDLRDLLYAIRDAIDGGVRAKAIRSAIHAVLDGETTETEAAMILRRLTRSKAART